MSTINVKKVENIIEENSLLFADYVIRNRALPSVADGLKPVYRKILYTMNYIGANKLTKSQDVEGNVMKFHPHAGSYQTIVGMVQKDNNVIPLIEGKGNFGQHTSRELQAAAPRYTEIKLSSLSKDIFKNLNKDIVNWIDNFDGTKIMPEFLPVKFPMILTIAQEGIAYGMSNKMPSFNIVDVCEFVKNRINDKVNTPLIPDFATGGFLVKNKTDINKIGLEGKGSITLRGKASINEKERTINITEIPYSTTREAIIEAIVKLNDDKKIKGVLSVKDLTGLGGMLIEVKCKKGFDLNDILEELYINTPLESVYACNMNILDIDGLPKTMGVNEIVDKWINWRKSCIVKYSNGRIRDLNIKKIELEALIKIADDIDELIDIIKSSNEDNILKNVMNKFSLNKEQSEFILSLTIKQLNKVKINKDKNIEKLNDIIEEINNLNDVVVSDIRKNNIISDDMDYIINNFKQDRRTNIIEVNYSDLKKRRIENIPAHDVKIIITKNGLVKKVKPNDVPDFTDIVNEFVVKNNGELIIFINKEAYKVKINSIKESSKNSIGESIYSLVGVDRGTEILGYTILDDNGGFIIICYDNGKIAKVDLAAFATKNNSKKLLNSLNKDSCPVSILTFREESDFIIINNKNKEINYSTSKINTKKTRNTQGVNTLKNVKKIKKKH